MRAPFCTKTRACTIPAGLAKRSTDNVTVHCVTPPLVRGDLKMCVWCGGSTVHPYAIAEETSEAAFDNKRSDFKSSCAPKYVSNSGKNHGWQVPAVVM
mmetsp:Transcript_44396/g.117797  ORF Transcript_44396/g.117797 Transcript_44396/m.117797 type:complete len:98 (-) Transcript_44396:1470-1763(-)